MNARQQELRREEDRKRAEFFSRMIREPGTWPRWPWLPLKKYKAPGEFPDLGVLHADDTEKGKKPRVYNSALFAVPRWYPKEGTTPFTEYESLDAILADGWIID